KLAQRRLAERAADRVGLRDVQLLLHRLEEVAQWMLRHCKRRLHASLRRALLTEMKERDCPFVDLRQVHGCITVLALVAQHQATTPLTSVSVSFPSSNRRARSARAASERLCVTTTMAISRSRPSSENNSWSSSLLRWSRLPD